MSNFDVHYAGDLHEGESVVKQACFDSVAFDMRQAAAERDAALAREVALREELDMIRKAVPNSTRELVSLQQRLAVAEQRIGELESILGRLIKDCLASDFNEHWDSFISAESALKPAAEPHKCIECESQYCHGVCVERGDDDERYKGAEGEGS